MPGQPDPSAKRPETAPDINILLVNPLPPGSTKAFKDPDALARMAELLPRRVPIERVTTDNVAGKLSVKVFGDEGLDLSEPHDGVVEREFEIPVTSEDKS